MQTAIDTMKRADEVVVHLAGSNQNDLLVKGNVMAASQPTKETRARQCPRWTEAEMAILREYYPTLGKMACAEKLGRTEAEVRYKASMLGLKLDRTSDFYKQWQARAAKSKVGKKRPEQAAVMLRNHAEGKFVFTPERRAAMSERAKAWHSTHEHPRGAAGMKHTPETLTVLAERSRQAWQRMTPQAKRDRAAKIIRTRAERGILASKVCRGSWHAGWRVIGDRPVFCRSRWEANYCRYLQDCVDRGTIADWDHEAEVFMFPEDLFGVSSYLPDFKVILLDGGFEYHEVKGWMDARSKERIAKMREHYPTAVLKVIDSKAYKKLAKKYGNTIDGWEA